MTIREKVARAICLLFEGEDKCPFGREIPPSDEPYMEDGGFAMTGKEIDEWGALTERAATVAIDAFLAAAAEPDEKTGISWHMRPDEATEEMLTVVMPSVQDKECYEIDYLAMLAAAPEFEWDK